MTDLLSIEGLTKAYPGVVANDEGDKIELQQADGALAVVRHSDIDQIKPQAVSIMPAGWGEILSEADLLDVVTYLQGLTERSAESETRRQFLGNQR